MIEAHYTTEYQVQAPQNFVASAPININNSSSFSDKEADKKLSLINKDIYEGAQKEKKAQGINKPLFFKILGLVGLTVVAIAGFSKIKKFFQKFF